MRTRSAVIAVLLAIVLVGAAAQAQGLVLRYKYTAGAVDNYVMKGAFEGSMRTANQGEMPIDLSLDGRMRIKTTAVTQDGVASQEMTLDRMEVNTTMMGMEAQMVMEQGQMTLMVNGQPMDLPQGMPGMDALGKPIKSKTNTRGQVLEVDLSGLGDMFGGFDPATMQEASVVFPEGPVSPGDSWSNSLKIPMAVMGEKMELTVNFTYKFIGTEKYKDADVARIALKGTAQMRGGADAKLESIKQSFSGYELFDYNAGRTPYSKMHMDQVMKMTPAADQPEVNMSIAGDIEMILQ
ncbi:MAG: hypothetical protein JSV65_00345 [Armatimonadota bacterium]|nr:MAG: hypothetical protein JSV65_00345 [Armatimonadota bacterium]